MRTTLEDRLQKAAMFLQEDNLEDSIAEYTEALKHPLVSSQKIDLYKVLGRLYQKLKMPNKAIAAFQESLILYETEKDNGNEAEIASVHNNLAAALLPTNVSSAIAHYKSAISFYEQLADSKGSSYTSHLANTHFALGEAFVQKGNLLYAKKHFKEAIKGYETLPELNFLMARAHYQLGIIYTDEFNLFDAKKHYTKALNIYEMQESSGNGPGMAIMAALHNNLAVTFNSMDEHPKAIAAYQRSLEIYKKLTSTHRDVFLPYEAATLNSLAILYASSQELEKAIDHMQQTIDAYHSLSDSHPEQYIHYLATSLHNMGLFYFEGKNYQKAEHFFSEALSLRRKMALDEPEAFGPDVCATALNLVELYQINLEIQLDISLKSKSLEILDEVKNRLDSFKDQRLVINNMRMDCIAQMEYFNSINLEALTLQYVTKKASEYREEINSTILPSEKLVFQQRFTSLLEEKQVQFPENSEINALMAIAYNDLAWLLLRMNQPEKAKSFIHKGQRLDDSSHLLICNLAHCYLLEKEAQKALDHYGKFLNADVDSQGFTDIIRKDLEILLKVGADKNLVNDIRKSLNI